MKVELTMKQGGDFNLRFVPETGGDKKMLRKLESQFRFGRADGTVKIFLNMEKNIFRIEGND